ncbi:hypothetical protein M409DRAFT_24378 [Zasmidium cellare ATCC 36951]|uniref:F-box domain-containing protein n=1 Tax=Zasmidium cellare ATCC 36951 TaxID=1080233 RepID=A0A6A6CEI3_ZASCE|nr:uncharacterized protein M409DRAFT_24378 [Zasmidium cellare ATCC 36951]KAF2165525.1 hypothetical protein M409DRAFT_24378 [Zasmidium cellare ATCC 36951]
MSLDQIPAELLHNVCSHCSKHEIRSLRLTSRFVSAVADEHFLRDLVLFYLRSEFDTVEEIVKNPRVAKGVRSVRFQADRLLSRGDGPKGFSKIRKSVARLGNLTAPQPSEDDAVPVESERQQRQRRREVVKHKAPAPAKLAAKEAEFTYLKLYLDQAELMTEERSMICMQRLFTACPKLDSAIVTMQHYADTGPTLMSPAPWHSVRMFLQLQVTPWRDDMSSRILCRPSNELVTAAFEAGRKLKSLTLSPISHQFFSQEEEAMAELHSVISELEQVHICLDGEFEFDRDDAAEEARMQAMEDEGIAIDEILESVAETHDEAARRVLGALEDERVARFLHHAPSLSEISLKGPIVDEPHLKPVELSHLVGTDPPWTHLRSLTLLEFSCEHPQLVALILKYRDSLEHLRLEGAKIDSSLNWWRVWEAIAGKLPKLKTFKIDDDILLWSRVSYWKKDAVQALERYILTGERPHISEIWM